MYVYIHFVRYIYTYIYYVLISFRAIDVTKTCIFYSVGAMGLTKPYEYTGFGATPITKSY